MRVSGGECLAVWLGHDLSSCEEIMKARRYSSVPPRGLLGSRPGRRRGCNGTYIDGGGWKNCYSDYVNNSKYHSSIAIIGPDEVKGYANAGYWSQADAKGGTGYTYYVYWNTY